MRYKISVVIPVYNVENFISECLESLLNQTYQNFDIYAVNDGSTDRSYEILESYIKVFQGRLKIVDIPNSGQATARNIGISRSKGDLIYLLDSDDYIRDDLFERAIKEFDNNEISAFLFSAHPFSNDDLSVAHLNYERGLNDQVLLSRDFFNKSMEANNYFVQPCCYIYKREDFPDLKFIDGVTFEDNSFTTEMLIRKQSKIFVSNEKFFFRRFRKGSTVTKEVSIRSVNNYLENIKYINDLSKKSYRNKYVVKYLNRLAMNAFRRHYGIKGMISSKYKYIFTSFCIRNGIFGIPILYVNFPNILERLKSI
ncbi:glycosyltransferase family 2 protein [Vibrio cyclitrophicus]|uniref:glycosyltransferase family 2 protein n=1 Tax=Vibrio cyclitrophicus TaxID=47951 RepID=UPI002070A0E7|nr:glycosyltransferase family 2 protein [Vibrio cyclitrophicus]UPR26465.1 glycosyltransferase family 2 protein [Vibrio cyclitrophicus]